MTKNVFTVIPLQKITTVNEPNELRPTSLLPLPGKLLERIMCTRLNRGLNAQEVLSSVQHGFRKNRSTTTAITTLLDQIYDNINDSQLTYIVYLDLKKAFDTVSHPNLLGKLQQIGLPRHVVHCFQSYLSLHCDSTLTLL